MQSVFQFSLVRSGFPFVVKNSVGIASGGSISISYVVSGGPATLSVSLEGCKNGSGDVALLDSYVGVASTTRTIALSDSYDFFNVTASWSGGNNVIVTVSMTTTGTGATQTSVQAAIPLSGFGSPAGVVAAPVGTIFVNLSGGVGSLFLKESGGSTSAGWVAANF